MVDKDESPRPAAEETVSVRKGEDEMPPASLEGQTLGKYRVLEPLGRGGMARVYRAYHPQLDRYVAIKVLRADLMEEEEIDATSWRVRFQREAQAVAALRHANIVRVFDSDVQDDVYYMVLELLEGDTLKTRLNDYRTRGERMPLGETVRILLDVLDGLAYAHSEGMIHRDIKPANVLLTRRGQAVIADFGIARIVGGTRHTVSGALMGTLNYMAPEQGLEGRSDARSDIYSLGIVLYEMLTQRTPFEADTPLAVLMKHVNDPLPLPRKIEPTVPEPFERVVLKALAKSADDRYQSAEEMAQALREAAVEAEVELPSRISLPFSFRTSEVPSESVAVFSGTARERITDAQFADDDTDTTLGQRLAEGAAGTERMEGERALGTAGKELLDAVGAVAHVAISKTAEALNRVAVAAKGEETDASLAFDVRFADIDVVGAPSVPSPPSPPSPGRAADRTGSGREERRRGNVGQAVLSAIGLIVLGNACMLTIAVPTDRWEIYRPGWPIEIFLVSWGLCIIMYVTSSIWMLIPIGPVLVTGIALTYCQLTGNWEHWRFLWLLEVWGVIVSVFTSLVLSRSEGLARGSSRFLAILLSLASIASILFIALRLV
jgi:serine/threonine protein kinase